MIAPKRNVLTFQWDKSESLGDEYLTPVYFNRQVLIRYLYDSRFSCEFASETYGTVHGEDFYISFGINKHGTVIAWLGDLMQKIPVREQFYWLVENKAPENDAASEFYDAQINAKFTEPPSVVRCLNDLASFNAAFHQKHLVHLYHDRSIDERIYETRRYKRLLMNNVDDFKRFISEFNEIINENVNKKEVRRLLSERGVAIPDGTKGNKLLQMVYESVLADSQNLIAPFFYLYDLRLWADHSMSDKNLQAVSKNLGVSSTNYQGLMEALVAAIQSSVEKLRQRLEA